MSAVLYCHSAITVRLPSFLYLCHAVSHKRMMWKNEDSFLSGNLSLRAWGEGGFEREREERTVCVLICRLGGWTHSGWGVILWNCCLIRGFLVCLCVKLHCAITSYSKLMCFNKFLYIDILSIQYYKFLKEVSYEHQELCTVAHLQKGNVNNAQVWKFYSLIPHYKPCSKSCETTRFIYLYIF